MIVCWCMWLRESQQPADEDQVTDEFQQPDDEYIRDTLTSSTPNATRNDVLACDSNPNTSTKHVVAWLRLCPLE